MTRKIAGLLRDGGYSSTFLEHSGKQVIEKCFIASYGVLSFYV
jgi:hypothetical protein